MRHSVDQVSKLPPGKYKIVKGKIVPEYKKMKKINIWALIIALALTGIFLWSVLNPPSVFNFLPFAIHEAIDFGGTSEKTFIIVFDVITSVLILIAGYRILSRMLK